MLDWLKWVMLAFIGIIITFIVAQGFTAHRTNLIDSQNTALETVSSVLNQFGDKTELTSSNLAEELAYELSREMTQNYNVDVSYDFFNEDGSVCNNQCEFVQFRIDLSNGKEVVSSMHKKFQLSVKE
ncbi:MAG: hypothetical protein ACRDAO_05680 [Culicoidibacterales bacterium]